MEIFDVGIIGAGIVGSFTFNMLTGIGAKVCLMEAGEDVSLGATKANSAIIHAGYDCQPGTKKAYFNVRGNAMYEEIAKRLGEKCYKTGSLVVADKDNLDGIKALYLPQPKSPFYNTFRQGVLQFLHTSHCREH